MPASLDQRLRAEAAEIERLRDSADLLESTFDQQIRPIFTAAGYSIAADDTLSHSFFTSSTLYADWRDRHNEVTHCKIPTSVLEAEDPIAAATVYRQEQEEQAAVVRRIRQMRELAALQDALGIKS